MVKIFREIPESDRETSIIETNYFRIFQDLHFLRPWKLDCEDR